MLHFVFALNTLKAVTILKSFEGWELEENFYLMTMLILSLEWNITNLVMETMPKYYPNLDNNFLNFLCRFKKNKKYWRFFPYSLLIPIHCTIPNWYFFYSNCNKNSFFDSLCIVLYNYLNTILGFMIYKCVSLWHILYV